MKTLVLAAVLCIFCSPAFASGYRCSGEGVTAVLARDEKSLLVISDGTSKTYPIVAVTSRTGDTDQTFETGQDCSLTIDEQYGDSLTLNGQEIPLSCK
jgi:hypothetical protein